MKHLITILTVLAAAAFPQLASATEFCDTAGCVEVADATYSYEGETAEESLYERVDTGQLHINVGQLSCARIVTAGVQPTSTAGVCRATTGRRASYAWRMSHAYGKDAHIIVKIVYWTKNAPYVMEINRIGQYITRLPQNDRPWCPLYDASGAPIAGTGHPSLIAENYLLELHCKAPQSTQPVTAQPAVTATEKVVRCKDLKVGKNAVKVKATTGCTTATTVLAKYVRTGKAPGWLCVTAKAGRVRNAKCVSVGNARAKAAVVTGAWRV